MQLDLFSLMSCMDHDTLHKRNSFAYSKNFVVFLTLKCLNLGSLDNEIFLLIYSLYNCSLCDLMGFTPRTSSPPTTPDPSPSIPLLPFYFENREKVEIVQFSLGKKTISFQGINLLLDMVLKYSHCHFASKIFV